MRRPAQGASGRWVMPGVVFQWFPLHEFPLFDIALGLILCSPSQPPNLNAEFQRIARRDKKPFLSNQCKEIEENNRMGNTRDLFKKIRDTKGNLET